MSCNVNDGGKLPSFWLTAVDGWMFVVMLVKTIEVVETSEVL